MNENKIQNIYFENDLYASVFNVENISEGLNFLIIEYALLVTKYTLF